MGTCKPLQKEIVVIVLVLAITIDQGDLWDKLSSPKPTDNKFIKHHETLVNGLLDGGQKIADCWICTHSPISATSIPFLAVPMTPEEVFTWTNCSDKLANNQTVNSRLWNTTVAIPVVGWVGFPWWQGNMTGKIDNLQYLAFKGGVWVPRNKTGLTDLGLIPTENIQLSFSSTISSSQPFKPDIVEKYIHNNGWKYSQLFPDGNNDTCSKIPGNILCNESSAYDPGTPTCENPDAGYCSPLGQKPPWCILQNVSKFLDLVHRLVLQHSAIWDLPEGTFWICGNGAYKWLPVGIKGTCTLGRLTPATFIVQNQQVDMQAVPKHTLYKRAADNSPRHSGRPHVVQMGIPNKIFSTFFVYPMLMQMWDEYDRHNDQNKDSWWSDTFSFLNPKNWFKGIGGWVAGILQGILQIVLIIVVIYVVF
ncbi:uncharacterized protein [Phyllobates terribilis]|uniref:uncharacterized protein n=1 Tax=Phyllobates terribilis TaxID=111132 RepID=UPI003CCA71F8